MNERHVHFRLFCAVSVACSSLQCSTYLPTISTDSTPTTGGTLSTSRGQSSPYCTFCTLTFHPPTTVVEQVV